ncbi:Adenine DNA glycosylase [Pararobbsia alpina]|uniref:A/G-specific adenine glycosylase n=1 Tax=Pararobbsia alpina TaxID=621374 RepID=UPI0039A58A76
MADVLGPAAGRGELIEQFAPTLVAWQRKHGRHDLPWQQSRDAYRVWLSEIMLQQTQVSTVIPYYTRFLERFPTVHALAAAPSDEVMSLWAGLGYYTRARNLHRCAQVVVSEHGGEFPQTVEALSDLPGIGRSTAAAIAAFSFGARETILDGNVKRVLARVFGIDGFPGEKRIENAMWELAESLLPPHGDTGIDAYTQGLMDLGATLCTRGRPDCAQCPFASHCVANATGRQRELPVARPRKEVPTRHTLMLVMRRGPSVWLERRPPTGIWGGLWSLPEGQDSAALAFEAERHGVRDSAVEFEPLSPLSHTFTHFRLEIEPVLLDVPSSIKVRSRDDSEGRWVELADLEDFGLPAPVKKLLSGLTGTLL